MKLIKVKIGKKNFIVKDCRGVASLRGLMFDSMEDHDGALIEGGSIWMPFVGRKLNLIFLSKDLKVLGQKTAVPLTWHPRTWRVYSSAGAKYCLELKCVNVKAKGQRVVLEPLSSACPFCRRIDG